MTKTLNDFLDFMEDDGFDTSPIPSVKYPAPEGKIYHVPSPNAETGLRLSALADLTIKMNKGIEISEADMRRMRLDDKQELEFTEQVLSKPLVDEMLADGVKWEHLKRLTAYAFTYFAVSPQAAMDAAREGAFNPKAVTPNRAQRRTKAKSVTSQDSPVLKTTQTKS